MLITVRGQVYWRSNPDQPPAWVDGTLVVGEGPSGARTGRFVPATDPAPARGEQHFEGWVVPGLVDLHAHLALGPQGPLGADGIRANAWAEIEAGVLAVREPGTPVRVDDADLPFGRPQVVSAGRHIALEKRYIRGMANEIAGEGDSAVTAALVEEVRTQAAEGTGWVKLVGDWIDRSRGPESDLDPLWSAEQLKAAVEAAHQAGARVAVHTFSAAAIGDLLDAGVDSIEHGSGMTRAEMEQAAAAGIPVVPTCLQVLKFPEFARAASKYPAYAQTMQRLYDGRRQWFTDLIESGVQLLPGSDAGGYQAHGSLIPELQQWVDWGMAPEAVLAAATWRARDFLGLPSLQQGAPADAVVYTTNPARDPEAWGRPAAVIANGHVA